MRKLSGQIILFITCKYDLERNLSARLTAKNSYFTIGPVLFFLTKKQNLNENYGLNTMIAPNYSGEPVVDSIARAIIGVMITTSLQQSIKYGPPALNTATSKITVRFHLKAPPNFIKVYHRSGSDVMFT